MALRHEVLIFTPTYNEAGNINPLIDQILSLHLPADIIVMDDNSPDGTSEIVDEISRREPRIMLWRRHGKLGIGSAHVAALRRAKAEGYKTLITLDADFSHRPADIPRFIALRDCYDVVVGSRYLQERSLEQWNHYRRFMTHFGHFLTKTLLRLPYDMSGAFRLYQLDGIPERVIDAIQSRDYEFFFESLTYMHLSGCRIGEVPINLPARTYGHSKMQIAHVARAVLRLLKLTAMLAVLRRSFRQIPNKAEASPNPKEMRMAWDQYWGDKGGKIDRSLYDSVASFYRNRLIKPTLNHFIRKSFAPGMELVHAGCGGGEVDVDVVRYFKVTAVDISPIAITKYRALHGGRSETVVADIFALSKLGRQFDGVYNLGVMEHFEDDHIKRLLSEFNRVLRPGGRIVLFWPPAYGLSVIVLHGVHFILNRILGRNVQLHPPEPDKGAHAHPNIRISSSGWI